MRGESAQECFMGSVEIEVWCNIPLSFEPCSMKSEDDVAVSVSASKLCNVKDELPILSAPGSAPRWTERIKVLSGRDKSQPGPPREKPWDVNPA